MYRYDQGENCTGPSLESGDCQAPKCPGMDDLILLTYNNTMIIKTFVIYK